jgi:hypothetical protein
MDKFSGMENRNRVFRKMAFISMGMSASVLCIYILQMLGVIPLKIF